MGRVLDISVLTLNQIRIVAKKLGFLPDVPLVSTELVEQRYLEEKMKIANGGENTFAEALGINNEYN